MALFQPSNITPSSFAGIGGGVVAASSLVSVTWQINGNSPMTGFRIQILDVDDSNTQVHDTGYIASGQQYSTDAQGNPAFYSYEPSGATWSSWGLTDGNSYLLKITQYWGSGQNNFVEQYSPSHFITRTAPSLTITDFVKPVATISQTFTASYTQAQGDPINWVRWQFASVVNGTRVMIDDTGEINTSVLSYTTDGMQSGSTYAINCIVETSSGVVTPDIWQEFTVSYTDAETSGGLSIDCSDKVSNLLEWNQFADYSSIPGTAEGSINYTDNGLSLGESASVTWNMPENGAIEPSYGFAWKGSINTNGLVNLINKQYSVVPQGITLFRFSPNGEYEFVYGPRASGSESGAYVTYASMIFSVDADINLPFLVTDAAFSPDNRCLAVLMYDSETLATQIQLYAISHHGYTLNFSLITSLSPSIEQSRGVSFSNDGSLLVCTSRNLLTVWKVNASLWPSSEYLGDTYQYAGRWQGRIRFNSDDSKMLSFAFDASTNSRKSVVFSINNASITNWTQTSINITTEDNLSDAFFNSSTGNIVLVGTYGSIQVYTPTGTKVGESSTSLGMVRGASISPSGEILLVSLPSGINAFRSNGNNYNLVHEYNTGDTAYVEFSPTGTSFAYGTMSLETWKYIIEESGSLLFLYGKGDSSHSANAIRLMMNGAEISLSIAKRASSGGTDVEFYEATMSILDLIETDVLLEQNAQVDAVISIRGESGSNVNLIGYFSNGDSKLSALSPTLTPADLPEIATVTLYGAQFCRWLTFSKNSNVLYNYNYVPPDWEDGTTLLLTHFDWNTLDAGNVAPDNLSADLYRENLNDGTLEKLFSVPADVSKLRDYGWITGQEYRYIMYNVEDGAYSAPIASESTCRVSKAYILLEASQDTENPNAYHVVRYWRFSNNISSGAVSNNNSPNFQTNFTRYRLPQPATRMGRSGTLQTLLSNVNPYTNRYADTAQEMKELFAASASRNQFFLKDMKGNLYMIQISAPVTQTIDEKSTAQHVTVSLSWEENGDCTGVSLIQLPTDDGWGLIDNSGILAVRLYVDLDTGLLMAQYPEGYTATQFSVTQNTSDTPVDAIVLSAVTDSSYEQPEFVLDDGRLYVSIQTQS